MLLQEREDGALGLKAKYIQRMNHYGFFQGMGGGQIYTKQNPTQENPCQRYKASYEKAII